MELISNLVFSPQAKVPLQLKAEPTFVSTVAHRRPSGSIPQKPSTIIPHKRKSAESSENSLVSSRKPTPVFKDTQGPSTTTPVPDLQHPNNVEVVIPSPSVRQRKLIKKSKLARKELTGLSQLFFPLDVEERAKAARRRYPKARHVDRKLVPFSIDPNPPKSMSISPSKFLRHMQMQELKRINGYDLSFDLDDEKLAILSANFGFVNEYKLQDGVTPAPSEFIAGCDCDGPCDEESCDCLNEELNSNKKIVPYHLVEGRMVLRPDFLKRKSIISECSSKCSCSGQCWNHVVQKGRSVRLQIFDTGARGFGSFTILFAYLWPSANLLN